MDVSKRLSELRQSENLSVYKLAQLSEISSTHIHAMENGETIPTIATLEKICTAFGIGLKDFFSGDPPCITPKQAQLLDAVRDLPPQKVDLVIDVAKSMRAV